MYSFRTTVTDYDMVKLISFVQRNANEFSVIWIILN